jgi:hypothetical protein
MVATLNAFTTVGVPKRAIAWRECTTAGGLMSHGWRRIAAYYAAHKAEINERKRRRRATDPEYRAKCNAARVKNQRANLLERFGMSWREYELRLALQNNACAICRKKPKRRLLCIDHCHKTGKVRGLLCTLCNAALGAFADDPKRMQAATDYLTAFYESLEPRGEVMTSTDGQTEAGKVGGLMRKAILLELQCEPGAAGVAADKLRLIARKLVDKATEGDIQAIKEVLDRIDGKSVAGPGDAEHGPRQVSIRWKDAAPSWAAS